MKPIARTSVASHALLEHLIARIGTARAAAVPDRLWERSLASPLREFLSRPGKASRARMVELAFCAAGGLPGAHPPELPLLIESLHAGSLIIDDIEDGSEQRRGAPSLHRLVGMPLALNTGNWLYFHAHELLGRMPLPSAEHRLSAYELMSSCLLRCHEGQALDLSARIDELCQHEVTAVAAAISSLKTGGLVSLGTGLAAIAAGARPAVQLALRGFGTAIGTGIQMLDDLSGLVDPRKREKAIEDLRTGRPTWVWAWLAQHASADVYGACLLRLAGVMRGEDPGDLLEALRFRVVASGRAHARNELALAARTLRAELGDAPALAPLERSIAQLEALYLEVEA